MAAERLLATIRKEQGLPPLPNPELQQSPRGTDLAGRNVRLGTGEDYTMQGPRAGVVVDPIPTKPINRLPSNRASAENPIITKGKPLDLPNNSDERKRQIDIAVKQAKGEQLGDDDLRFMAEKAIDAQNIVRPPATINNAQLTPGNPTVDDIAAMSPEQRIEYQTRAHDQNIKDQMGMFDQFGQQQKGMFDQRIDETEKQIEETRVTEEAKNQQQLDQFKADQQFMADGRKQDVTEAGQEGMDQLKRNLARRGMSRSSDADSAVVKATKNTQRMVDAIEQETNSSIRTYQVQLLDKMDQKIAKLEDRAMNLGDQSAAADIQLLKERQKTYSDLFSQSPRNPTTMIELADKLKSQQLEELKENNKNAQEMRKEARENFQWMVTSFGSQAFAGMDDESLANYASNIGMTPQALRTMGKTIKEQETEWDKLKYFDSQDFEINKQQMQNDFEMAKDNLSFDRDIYKLGLNLENDKSLEQFKTDLKKTEVSGQRDNLLKALGVKYGEYASGGDGSGLNFSSPVPHPAANTNVTSMNAALAQAYPDGFRFQASDGPGGLGGQCKWFAQQLTQFADGSGWLGGSTLADTQKNFDKYQKQGKAFKVGQGEVKPGMSVLSSDSKTFGHGYVINAITPEGKWVVTESNYKGPLTVSNNRIVDPKDPKIIGVLKTVPKGKYQVPVKQIGSALGAALKNAPGAGPVNSILNTLGKITQTNVGNEINKRINDFNSQPAPEPQGLTLSDNQIKAIDALPQDQKEILINEAPEVYAAYVNAGSPKNANKDFTQMNQLYGRVEPVIKEVRKLNDGFSFAQSYKNLAQKDNYTDQSLIFSYMKVLDPGSVVRSDEFATAMKNQGILDTLGVTADNIAGKAMLSERARQSLLNVMEKKYAAQMDYYRKELEGQNAIFERQGFNPADIYPQEFIFGDTSAGGTVNQQQNTLKTVKSKIQSDLSSGHSAQDIVNGMLKSEYAADVQADLNNGYSAEELIKLYTQ